MSSQLPNIRGSSNHTCHSGGCGGAVKPLIKGDPYHTGHGWGGNYRDRGFEFSASYYNPIYQDDVNEVFGNSISMNAYIKALI